MPGEDMDRRKERMRNECKKIVDSINLMSFDNLDDQSVHSLVKMREIARGVLFNHVEKVTKSDVKRALSSSIEKMVGSCRDVINILSRMPCEGLDNQQKQSILQMKEIALGVVNKRPKGAATQHCDPCEMVEEIGAEIVESEADGAMYAVNQDFPLGMEHSTAFADELLDVGAEIRNGDGQSEAVKMERIEGIILDSRHLEVHSVPSLESGLNGVHEGLADRLDTGNVVHVLPAEGMMFENEQLEIENDLRAEDGQSGIHQRFLNGEYQRCNENSQIIGAGTKDELHVEDNLRTEDSQNKVVKSPACSTLQNCLSWPPDGRISLDWVQDMMSTLEQLSKKESLSNFGYILPLEVVDKLIDTASSILSKEPNCVQVDCGGEDAKVVVVGDICGQFHDLLNLFQLAGLPSKNQVYIFNGNYVNRGAWGLEVFLVLLAWKVLMPCRVYLLRGSHETKYCTSTYGFKQEVKTKYGDQGEYVYNKCLGCFIELPLASVIASCVYTTHGGLFRKSVAPLLTYKRKRAQKLELGSLEDLSKIKRSLADAPKGGQNILLTDVLWSDPSKENGLTENTYRGLALWWGPDCTETFLKQSNLKVIIRSHEGPDGRVGQDDFGDMMNGYSLDHVVDSGKLYTLFSAPDYPQFGAMRYDNEGAYAELKPPDFVCPCFHTFKAVERPKVDPYVALDLEDVVYPSEEETTKKSKNDAISSPQTVVSAEMNSRIDFKSLGIANPPSWSVTVADGGGGTQVVQVPKVPVVEGLPLPSNLQEPHKAAYEYFLELIAGLKHMLSTKASESAARESAT